MKKYRRDYLFQRSGSRNWWLRLHNPDGTRIERSLHTSDRVQAELEASDDIAKHRKALLEARPRYKTKWMRDYEPGLHEGSDGGRIAATEKELSYYDAAGKLIETKPNGGFGVELVRGRGPFTVQNLSQAVLSADLTDVDAGGPLIEQETRRKIPLAGGDDAIIDAYLEYKNITGYYEREARDTWATFRSLVDKPLKRCEREDGRELVKYYQEQGSKSATIKKRVGWLRAAVNFAIEERRLDFNPFLKIVPNLKDKLKREKLTEDEVSLIKRNLDDLDANDQLLVHLIATTGMRLAEAYEIGQVVKKKVRVKDGSKWKIVEREAINGDKIEDGIRFVIVGTKTEQSLRRVPFPESILPLLPKKIVKPLFTRSADDPESAASKRLNRFLRDLGITDPAKVGAHSFRHRAQDRLRAAKCPLDIRWEILGHEKKTVAANYGEGHPLPELKQWIDKIGF